MHSPSDPLVDRARIRLVIFTGLELLALVPLMTLVFATASAFDLPGADFGPKMWVDFMAAAITAFTTMASILGAWFLWATGRHRPAQWVTVAPPACALIAWGAMVASRYIW